MTRLCRVLDSGEVHGVRRTPDLPECRVRTSAAGATALRKCSANFISDLRRVHDVSVSHFEYWEWDRVRTASYTLNARPYLSCWSETIYRVDIVAPGIRLCLIYNATGKSLRFPISDQVIGRAPSVKLLEGAFPCPERVFARVSPPRDWSALGSSRGPRDTPFGQI